MSRRGRPLCALHALLLAIAVLHTVSGAAAGGVPKKKFLFWTDYPGSATWKSKQPSWWDLIEVKNGSSFTSVDDVSVEVNWDDHKAIHLYADPSFLKGFDEIIAHANGPLSSTMTGTIDECGWPAKTPSEAPASLQWTRRTTPFVDDFRNGLQTSNWVIATGSKGCCDPNVTINVNIGADTVNGHVKNVLELTAWNADMLCPGLQCRKYVESAGMVSTAAHFASARYEVQAKVPAAEGVVWAVWTFHYEEHLPAQCDRYTCFCGDGGKAGCPLGKCMPSSQYELDACPMHGPGYTEPCHNTTICDQYWDTSVVGNCGMRHLKVGPDPQFMGSSTFSGYIDQVNHEIDIEIPANCEKTTNVCNPSCDYDYSTANFNNYIYTNDGGEGPAYTNMCVKVNKGGTPMKLIGDGQYHTYRFDWHSGTPGNVTSAYVDFFIDDIYMGTNNAFVPTRASRFSMSLWGAGWNGHPNNWGGGHPGDGKRYSQTALVSEVKITPFNEPADIAYMTSDDQPTGCDVPVTHAGAKCHLWTELAIPPAVTPTSDDDDMTDDDAPPPPPDCTAPSDRTNGCPCAHSQQCASDWCTGVPATCERHP